jgi:hypothetical protein
MIHECPGCNRAYYCAHKNCDFGRFVRCDECVMKDRYAKPKAIHESDEKRVIKD